MNNYWETNYRAAQQGKVSFRYVLCPHGTFNSAIAEKRALEEAEPPVIIRSGNGGKGMESLFSIDGANIICTALIPAENGYLIRLFNAGGTPEKAEINFKKEPAQLWLSDFDDKIRGTYNREDVVPAYGLRTIRVITD